MADYIKREDAIAAVEFDITYATAININTGVQRELFGRENAALEKAVVRLREVQAAEVRPVIHARWIVTARFDDCYYADCPACNTTQVFYGNKELTTFCPNCGAMMDGEG